jgi:2-dehydro-3-deoxyphosphogluconate aldolase/(4S)-4-hydroxy-2-oxoglutarate aldolase
MGILRGIDPDAVEPLVETVISSGLKTIEITMNTPDAPKLIRRAVKLSGKRLSVGAGTVLTEIDFKKALDSGASFIVTPVLLKDIVELCVKKKLPVFPGALTPREIYEAWRSGASMVKVFPAKFFGPGYFKELKGPFSDIKLLACGGVTSSNIKSFFECGASAVAFGAGIFKKEWLKRREFYRIKECIEELIYAGRDVL